jgi:tetratricopeptide (TPR) repeat protein
VKLSHQAFGADSFEHANALKGVGIVELGLEDFLSAKRHFNEAIDVLEGLRMQNSPEYGSLLMNLADVDREQDRFQEALDGYTRAKSVLENFKEHPVFGVVISRIGTCLEKLMRYTDAVACYRESIDLYRTIHGAQHPEYATSLVNLAYLYQQIKQFELAIALYEEAVVISKRVYGESHPNTLMYMEDIAKCRTLQKKERKTIKTDHAYRMCNACFKVATTIKGKCLCDKVYYCSHECQEKLWAQHKPDCVRCYGCGKDFLDYNQWQRCPVCHLNKYCSNKCREKDKDHACVARCYQCRKDGVKLMKCSACAIATYCSAYCQKAHWSLHKGECKKK